MSAEVPAPPAESAPRRPVPARPAPPAGPRTTSRRVKVADFVAGAVVRAGGAMVVVAVVGILVFLVATAVPLFRAARIEPLPSAGRLPIVGSVRFLAVDEYRMIAAAVGEAPEIVYFRADTGEPILRFPVGGLAGARVTAAHRTVRSDDAVLGTSDGRLAFLHVGFASDFVLDDRKASLRASMREGDVRLLDDGVVRRVTGGNLLRVKPDVSLRGVARLPAGEGAITAVAYASQAETGAALAVRAERDVFAIRETTSSSPVGPAERTYAVSPLDRRGQAFPTDLFSALVDEDARFGYLVSRSGEAIRADVSSDAPAFVEARRITTAGAPSSPLSAAELLIGGRSLVLGDEAGEVSVWSLVQTHTPERIPLSSRDGTPSTLVENPTYDGEPADHKVLSALHRFPPLASAVRGVFSSALRRDVCVGLEDGSVSLLFATNERVLGSVTAFSGPVAAAAIGPKDDGILVAGPGGSFRGFAVDMPHPETNFAALFLPIHYEGFDGPELQYQSGAGTQEAELKLSLTPLLFGTLKGTFYAMLFALPLALLAALYTSQFMHPRVRAVVKPAVEVMASLPSVVLGFLAALVLAPALETKVPALLAVGVLLPIVAFLAGVAWHRIPLESRQRLGSAARLGIAAVLVAATLATCWAASGLVESAFFGGDFRAWLRQDGGTTFVQQNCIVVGIAMGFAIIPIIYTIAEDAISAIPESLKSAALACGASPWQAATRVVLPAAVPGIFAATMVGLGRAVGETMIVLMATGGTPIMDTSIFNGFRSLSVNIATELSEAPQGGTLYRVLFLAGLLLFALTFVFNTIAELVRQRFRRRFRAL